MADDKQARDDQADNETRRQRERALAEELTRADEPAPVHRPPGERLGDLDAALAEQDYPTTTALLVEELGEYEVETRDGWRRLDAVLPATPERTFVSATAARARIQGLIGR